MTGHAPTSSRSTSAARCRPGVTVLEASAGTGKTFTIAALAARYVAEGTPLEQLLLVTFTRMATGELRERVRERLVSAEQGLDRALAGAPADTTRSSRCSRQGTRDEVAAAARAPRPRARRLRRRHDRHHARLLPGGARRPRRRRRRRARRHLRRGRRATCSRTSSTTSTSAASTAATRPQFDRARGDADRADRGRQPGGARSSPSTRPRTPIAAMRRRLALRRRATSSTRRKRRMAVMTYDDLLTRLDDTLKGPGGEAAAARLRERYRVVLVDEFQDTDPVQWDIMRRAFGDGGVDARPHRRPEAGDLRLPRRRRLRLPRGRARRPARSATLEVNWRSDQGLIDAYDALFGGAKLGHEGIVYRQVRAADANQTPRLHRRARRARRCASGSSTATSRRSSSRAAATRQQRLRARARRQDLAADLAALLSSDAEIEIRAEDGTTAAPRARSAPATSPSSSAPTATPRSSATRSTRSTSPPSSTARAASSAPRRRATGCACSRRSSARRRPPRAALGRAHAVPRLDAPSGSPSADEDDWEELHRRLHQWARVLRVQGRRVADRDDHAGRGPARARAARCVDGERAADRPAPRRPAAARRGDGRAAGRRPR